MELFDYYKAVLLPQENKILITSESGYIYYVYDCQKKYWYKYDRAGNVQITIDHYPAVSKEVLIDAMHGVLPQKKADFIKLCHAFQDVSDISEILEADYPDLMADYIIMELALDFLRESPILHSSYPMLRKILDDSIATECDKQHLAAQIKRLSYIHIGKDIFKQELRIFDNAYLCGGFHIMPARLIGSWDGQYSKDDIVKMRCVAIGIGEDDVWNYLSPFLCKHYAKDLEANKRNYAEEGFDWYSDNYYTFASIVSMLKDINDTIDALRSGKENEFTVCLQKRVPHDTYANHDEEASCILDFYHRFIYRMEYMMQIAKENGYDLIAFQGP